MSRDRVVVEQFVLQYSMMEHVANEAADDGSRNDWQIKQRGNQHDDVVRYLI